MKKILSFLLSCITATACAQITLDHTFSPEFGSAAVYKLSLVGDKIATIDTGSSSVLLYNTDYSLWKTITTLAPTGYKLSQVSCISDHLFNSDDLVEMVVNFTAINYTTTPSYIGRIINEDNALIQDLGNCFSAYIVTINGGYKLESIGLNQAPYYWVTNYYSLPGTAPCGLCGVTGVQRTSSGVGLTMSDPIPNPASDQTSIFYTLPIGAASGTLSFFDIKGQIIKQQTVFGNLNSVEVLTKSFTSGQYLYSISVGDAKSQAKQLIIQ